MARTRLLKPQFFENEDLADLPMGDRLLFQGLWLHADRTGTLEDRPRRLKVSIFPYDDYDVDAALQRLMDSPGRFIIRYTVGAGRYIVIPTFGVHQRPHHKEPSGEFPALPKIVEAQPEIVEAQPLPNCALTLNPSPLTLNPSTPATQAGGASPPLTHSSTDVKEKAQVETLPCSIPSALEKIAAREKELAEKTTRAKKNSPPKKKTTRAKKSSKFVPPSVEDVKAYVNEKGYGFDAEVFIAHYETRGWYLSKGVKMVSWKSACTTWHKNEDRFTSGEDLKPLHDSGLGPKMPWETP